MVGLKAESHLLNAVKEYGYILFLGGIVVTLVPSLQAYSSVATFEAKPHYCSGGLLALTMIAGVAAVQEKSDSPVVTLGYSYTVAFGHICSPPGELSSLLSCRKPRENAEEAWRGCAARSQSLGQRFWTSMLRGILIICSYLRFCSACRFSHGTSAPQVDPRSNGHPGSSLLWR